MMVYLVCRLFDSQYRFNHSFMPLTEELLIDFRELIGEHSGENMAEAVWATMELYGLVGKVSFLHQIAGTSSKS